MECGCCELNEFEPTGEDDEPWCASCGHSPEEHEPSGGPDPNVVGLPPGWAGALGTSGWADRYTGGRY